MLHNGHKVRQTNFGTTIGNVKEKREESIRMTEDRDKWRKYVHGWCDQPSDQGRLRNRTEPVCVVL